jgi:flap endonuclease-1
VPNRDFYVEVSPELIQLKDLLEDLNISREQLVDLCILMGTDFNPGIEGIGPKRALKLIKDNGRIEAIKGIDLRLVDIEAVRSIFFNIPTMHFEREPQLLEPDKEGLLEFLCYERNFSRERIEIALNKINHKKAISSGSLDSWL